MSEKGKVKWFDSQKGYGFIITGTGEEIFIHYTSIQGSGFRDLQEGQEVEFEVTEGSRGKQAIKVKRINPPGAEVG